MFVNIKLRPFYVHGIIRKSANATFFNDGWDRLGVLFFLCARVLIRISHLKLNADNDEKFELTSITGKVWITSLNPHSTGLHFGTIFRGSKNENLARIFHELLSRDHETGNPLVGLSGAQRARIRWACHRATVPRYRGIGSEAYLNGTSQGPTPEDAREDGHIRGRSK